MNGTPLEGVIVMTVLLVAGIAVYAFDPSKPFRFSIRGLLVATAVIAGALGIIAYAAGK